MGEPAGLSLKSVNEAMKFAKSVVESVRSDTPFPLTGLSDDGQYKVLIMAQCLCWLDGKIGKLIAGWWTVGGRKKTD